GTSLDSGIVDLCRGADLLVHDAQYTPEELVTRRGWGHSSYLQAIECARLAGVKKLVLTHHDPDHDDAFLSEIEGQCQDLFPNCVLAREKMTIVV
ncbi:MAG TPA: MBL fold metallo-hydrolase, partial [Terrimicrobiaceae bacterium]